MPNDQLPQTQPQPQTQPERPRISRVGIGVLILVVIAGGYYVFTSQFMQLEEQTPQTLSEEIRTGTAPRPAVTEATTINVLKATGGFDALVSYTDRGFEPSQISVKKGDTIRFTNNSSEGLKVLVNTEKSGPLAPQEFWEFTFETTGDWQIANDYNEGKTGVVHVK